MSIADEVNQIINKLEIKRANLEACFSLVKLMVDAIDKYRIKIAALENKLEKLQNQL